KRSYATAHFDEPRRIAADDCSPIDVVDHHRSCCNHSVVVDVNIRTDKRVGRNPNMAADGEPGAQEGKRIRLIVVRSPTKVTILRDYGVMPDGDLSQVVYLNAPRDYRMVADLQQPGRHDPYRGKHLNPFTDPCAHHTQQEVSPAVEQAR